jgi:hypothetical protein
MGCVEKERSLYLVPFPLVASYPRLGVVIALGTYGWVENHSYIACFLDLLELKCNLLIVVYEYEKIIFNIFLKNNVHLSFYV